MGERFSLPDDTPEIITALVGHREEVIRLAFLTLARKQFAAVNCVGTAHNFGGAANFWSTAQLCERHMIV